MAPSDAQAAAYYGFRLFLPPATTTIHKRIQFERQFMSDAFDWKIIDENPFFKVKTQKSSVKVNEFVPREVVDKRKNQTNQV